MKKENVSYQDKIDELRFDFAHPLTKNKTFILLEGDSDVRLYRKLYAEERFKIEVLPGGKMFLEKGLQELSSLFKAIIGIRDADFAHLENQKPCLANLFFTDFHDTEMLMVASDKTFSAVLHEFCDLPQTAHEKLRKDLLIALRFVSYFRWYNERNSLGFSFKGATFVGIFEPNNFFMDNNKYVEKIILKSINAQITPIDVIFEEVSKLVDENHDDFQLCNGHDFMCLLSSYLKDKNAVSEKTITSHFRTAYQLSSYHETNLYQSINQWLNKPR